MRWPCWFWLGLAIANLIAYAITGSVVSAVGVWGCLIIGQLKHMQRECEQTR